MRSNLLAFLSLSLIACGAVSPTPDASVDAGQVATDAGTQDLFAGTWRLSGNIGMTEFVFPLRVVAASDGNYRGEYAGCVMPLEKTTATRLVGIATSCSVAASQIQDSTYYGGMAPQYGSTKMLSYEAGTVVSVVAGVMTVTGVFNVDNSRVPFTMSGSKL